MIRRLTDTSRGTAARAADARSADTGRRNDGAFPELPRVLVDATPPSTAGFTVKTVQASGGDYTSLATALTDRAAATGVDWVIRIAAGYSQTAPGAGFSLPAMPGSEQTVIESQSMASLPALGTRVVAADATNMPLLKTTGTGPVFQFAQGAKHYWLQGLEIALDSSHTTTAVNFGLVIAGEGGDTLSQLPENVHFNRCYVHGKTGENVQRAFAMHAKTWSVTDCRIALVYYNQNDSQGIWSCMGQGPCRIENCFIEAAGENVMFGGADPSIVGNLVSDGVIRRNHMTKQAVWYAGHPSYTGPTPAWVVKNVLELKHGRRILVEGNVFEHNFAQGQDGMSILFTVRNETNGAPWAAVHDVTFRYNLLRDTAGGLSILGQDTRTATETGASEGVQRVLIHDNIFQDIANTGTDWFGLKPDNCQLLSHPRNVQIVHNTWLKQERLIANFDGGPKFPGLVIRDNIFALNAGGSGVSGSGGEVGANTALNAYTEDGTAAVWKLNGLIGDSGSFGSQYPSAYPGNPTGTVWVADSTAAAFTNYAGGNYRLQGGSPFNIAGTDGRVLGCDQDALEALTTGVT